MDKGSSRYTPKILQGPVWPSQVKTTVGPCLQETQEYTVLAYSDDARLAETPRQVGQGVYKALPGDGDALKLVLAVTT